MNKDDIKAVIGNRTNAAASVKSREAERQEINSHISDFLARGGKIDVAGITKPVPPKAANFTIHPSRK
jgi:hypothetical protein